MTFTIPGWMIAVFVTLAPFLALPVLNWKFRARGSYDFTPVIGLGLFLIIAAACWSGVAVWVVMGWMK